MTTAFDSHTCTLGEGPLWHPLRQQLFWFDILNRQLKTRDGAGNSHTWQFDTMVSSAGWIDQDHLLIASELGLLHFNIETGERQLVCKVEAELSSNRSNDGRADPWGGFWFGTMGKQAQKGAGSFYRYYQGEIRQLVTDITITNSLCFSPDRHFVYYSDTAERTVWRQALSPMDGWPIGQAQVFLDLREQGLNPDGAVCDSNGNIWIAFWGANEVGGFDSHGETIGEYRFPASQVSCPAFGGPDNRHLYVTTAAEGLTAEQIAGERAGQVFVTQTECSGQPETQVIL